MLQEHAGAPQPWAHAVKLSILIATVTADSIAEVTIFGLYMFLDHDAVMKLHEPS